MKYFGASVSKKTWGPIRSKPVSKTAVTTLPKERKQHELTDGVSGGPDDKVQGHGNRFLGLATHVSRQHGQSKCLSGPEGQGDIIADDQANLLWPAVRRHRHETDGADEGRDAEAQHGHQVLARLLDDPHGAQQHDDDIEAQHHRQQLGLEQREPKALDDDALEATQPAGRQRRTQLDEGIAPDLRVPQGFVHLLLLELAVLHASLVGPHTLDHQPLVFLGEAVGTHRRVGHPPADEEAVQDRDDAVR